MEGVNLTIILLPLLILFSSMDFKHKIIRWNCRGLKCGDFAQVRNNCFHADNMKQLIQDIHIDSIMTFLRQINLNNTI